MGLKSFTRVLSLFALLVLTAACGDGGFQVASTTVSKSAIVGEDVVPDDGTGGGGGGTVITPGQNDGTVPTVSMKEIACVTGSHCNVTLQLSVVHDKEITIGWANNDNAWKTPSSDPNVTIAKPEEHYKSSSGALVFAAGEKEKTFTFENVAKTDATLQYHFLFRNCAVAGTATACTKFFAP